MDSYKVDEGQKLEKKPHPYVKANILSKLFFIWMIPTFIKGFNTDLNDNDLFPSMKAHESTYLGDQLENEWHKEMKRRPKNPSLWRALGKVFGKTFIITGLFFFVIEVFVRTMQPLFLASFLKYYEPNSLMDKTEAYYYATGIVICSFLSTTFQHTFMLHIFHLGLKMRVATASIVYRKALKLSKSALVDTTVGQMVNLISNDVGRFETATANCHYLWLAPFETIFVLILIYYNVGLTGIAGVLLLILFIPLQMWLGRQTSFYRLATAIKTDERIRLMNEIVSGIQVIKMYTWEIPFSKLVEISRRKEIDEIKKISIIRGIMMSFNLFLNRSAIYLCVMIYVLTGNTLNTQYVYVLTSFYVVLRSSVTMFFPQGVTQLAEANISVKRIKKFLLYDEVEFDSSDTFFNAFQSNEEIKMKTGRNSIISTDTSSPAGIHLKNLCAKWNHTMSENSLENITIDLGSNQLAAVVGPVGSGKSTLLHAILGELSMVSGTTNVNGKISYASQEPWLFVGSVRQNIIFGQIFNSKRYNEVIKVCALERDFQLFPNGDRTIVGERGVSLSGGQRARINLARAVYKQADIYLLDDPLSAVDTHVGKQLFDECINGYLRDKCVILVTHQLQYLKHVKQIYLFDHGRIEHSGTYKEVQNSGMKFTELLNELKSIMDEDDTEDIEQNGDDGTSIRSRKASIKKLVPKDNDKDNKDTGLEEESRASGKIGWNIYKSYITSGGHWCKILTLFIVFLLAQIVGSLLDYYLTFWVNINQIKTGQNQTTFDPVLYVNENPNALNPMEKFWMIHMYGNIIPIIYSILLFLVITLTISRSLFFYRFCNKASIRMHNNMFYKIVYATMRFFNTNPSGRILNRFSKDMNQVDEVLPLTLLDTLQISMVVLSIVTIIATVNVWMLVPIAIILVIFYFARVVFLATSRDIKRLEATTRSPIYSHLTASLQGLTTIRAFGAQQILKNEFDAYQNLYSSAYFMFLGANRTFGFWLDMHCVIFVSLVTLSFLVFDTESFGGNVGLAITQSLSFTGMFQWGMRQWSELENNMTSVERIKEYTDVTPEKDDRNVKDPPGSWPELGNVQFDNLSLRYAENEPLILKNINFSVKSTEKIGIVGRTGAGKSSIIMALFRLAVNEGRILIDNVDTSKITRNRLRSSISIIPQEPVLFSGTLRKNLDPFDEFTDNSIWSALDEVELKSVVSELPQGLESKMSEGGSNFSIGQRQLICLARAIVRKNKVLVLDEATANVDPITDSLIQTTIRKKFSNCTVFTIAHRLHTIMDSDKVLVMDGGRAVEFGHPYELLNANGPFCDLVKQTGKAMAENLYKIAEENYNDDSGSVKTLE